MSELSQLPKSPITGNAGVKVFDTILVEDIIRLYREQENVNVERFFKHGETIRILECEATKYRFYYPFECIGDASFYENLRNSDYDRDEAEDHKFAYKQIGKDAKLLEIGCGTGKFLEQVSHITKNVAGLELNSLAAKSAVEKGFDVKIQFIEEHAKENENCYDVVCAFQVLEHIAEVKSFIDAALKLLKPNGKLIFSVPNNEPFFQRFSKYEVLNLPPHHMGLWSLEAFKNLDKFYGMKLEDFQFTGRSSFKADAYLRAKLTANVKSLPQRHSLPEKLKIIAVSPIALAKSSLDHLQRKKNNAHISIVFIKN
jgi:2-polyprenyl-3-methyl-5-hydroxy-6-metoxy-1,4-benzoquinol methylase